MANLPPSLSMGTPFGVPSSSTGAPANKDRNLASAEQLVLDLSNPELRENALLELSKKRELFQDLAPLLWNSFGTIAALLQEIVSIYPVLAPPNLTPAQSNRVCNSLALLQCVASHSDTRMLFLKAHIPLYLYPFLNTTSKSRPFEYLRLTSLGVIGALVKVDDTEVISFLLSTEIIPLCLRTMEMGSELSKTVATFIVQKILLDDVGMDYICTTAERFFAVGRVLGNMVQSLVEQPSPRLLKHIIRCYLRLSDNPRACVALGSCLPDSLRDGTFSNCLREDQIARRWLQQLVHNVGKVEDLITCFELNPSLECLFVCVLIYSMCFLMLCFLICFEIIYCNYDLLALEQNTSDIHSCRNNNKIFGYKTSLVFEFS